MTISIPVAVVGIVTATSTCPADEHQGPNLDASALTNSHVATVDGSGTERRCHFWQYLLDHDHEVKCRSCRWLGCCSVSAV